MAITWGKALGFLFATTLAGAALAGPADPRHGQVDASGSMPMVWDDGAARWVTPQAFWVAYARTTDGKFWGHNAEYPPFREVSEHDTLLIQGKGGVCLMYFFHGRWRRAQDVRRWDPAFNDIGACPHVFD